MQTIRRAQVVVLLLYVACAAVVAGCGAGVSIPLPGASGPLLIVETTGGECFAAPCGASVIVERDGRVHSAAKPPNDLGTLPPDVLAGLDAAIRAADFATIRSHPFTGECPTTFDGQEFIFVFGTPGGQQRISSCEVEVDFGNPLFATVGAALAPFVPLPVE
jgi:hypothetical protein